MSWESCQSLAALTGSRAWAATPRLMPGTNGPAAWQSSKYLPVTPSTRGDAASRTEVAAPLEVHVVEEHFAVDVAD
jgi:hypothetical protein